MLDLKISLADDLAATSLRNADTRTWTVKYGDFLK
jgi:hypothetical protein